MAPVCARDRGRAARSSTAALVSVLALVSALAGCSSSKPRVAGATTTTTPPSTTTTTQAPSGHRVDVFGDSLTVQASGALRAQGLAHGLNMMVVGYYGLAPCDLAGAIRKDLERPPQVIVYAFSGNNLTPCMTRAGHRLVGAPYFAAYRHDVDGIVAAATARRIPVLIVGPPVFPPDLNDPDRLELNAVYRQIAASHPGAQYVETATALGAGAWMRTLPCVAGETAALGCHDGIITVRGPSRIHFDDGRAVPCPSAPRDQCRYSAGAHRYADAILAGLAKVAGLGYLPAPATAGVPIDVTKDG